MRFRRRLLIFFILLLIVAGFASSSLHLLPLNLLSVQQKPNQEQKIYEYYIVYDEKTGEELMHVPLVVSVGDDILTEDDRMYTIIKVEENRAYARLTEDSL